MNLGKEMAVNVVSVIEQLLLEVLECLSTNIGYSILFADFLSSSIYSQNDLEIIKKQLMKQYSSYTSPSKSDDLNQSIFQHQQSGSNEEESMLINRMLYHNCRNNQEISFVSTAQRMSIPCQCSYIENFVRFSSYLVPSLILNIQDIIIRLQCIPLFKKNVSQIIPKMLYFIDYSSKILSSNISNTNFFSPFLLVQRFTFPVEYGCQMILNMNQFGNIFSILSKMIEGMALQTRYEQLWEVMQILHTLKSLTSQSEVNFLILLTDTTFLKNLLKTLSKIEKRGIYSSFGQQSFYYHISQIGSCQSILQCVVYQIIRDMTFLANDNESDIIFKQLQKNISNSNFPSAKKITDLKKSEIKQKNEEMLQLFFSAWFSNYESVQFDKKSISNMVNSKQDFLIFSSLVSILIYSCAYRDLEGQVEKISYSNMVNTLMKYLQNDLPQSTTVNNKNENKNNLQSNKNNDQAEGQSSQNKEQSQKDVFLKALQSLFIDLDNNIHKNPYCIFSKEYQVEQLTQITNMYQYTQNSEQLELSLSIYKNQWLNHNNEVILLLRQIGLLIVGENLHDQFFEPFPKIVEQIEEKGQPKVINALNIPIINSEINRFSDNACLSFLFSYHFQFLKSNFMSINTYKPLTVEKMDIHLRSSLVQSLIQFFFLYNNQITMAEFKEHFIASVSTFKRFGLNSEELLIKYADFNPKKKLFSLKKQYLAYGSNLTIWNTISFLNDKYNLYEKNWNSEITGTVQDILFVQEDFSFNQIVTIDNITYQFNYMPNINIINFTRFITSEKLIKCLQTLYVGIKNITKNISLLTLFQYIIYFIKESKQSPEIFAEVNENYKPSLYNVLYENYIKNNLLKTFISNIIQFRDTQNIQSGCKTLIKMINTLVQQEEGIQENPVNQEQQNLTSEEIEKEKEEQRKKRIEEQKRRQQEMLQKFAQQRTTFQAKQDNKEEKKEEEQLPEHTTLKKQFSVVKNQDNETEFCSICTEQIEKNSEFGYPIYIKQINTLSYLQKLENEPEQQETKDENFYISVNSCGHFYHHACWLQYQAKNSKRDERSAYKFRNESEIPCSFCKRLANNFIQYIPESMRSRYQKKTYKQFSKENVENGIIFTSQKLIDNFIKVTTDFNIEDEDNKDEQTPPSSQNINNDAFFKLFEKKDATEEDLINDKDDDLIKQVSKDEGKEANDKQSSLLMNSLNLNKSLSKSILFTQSDFISNVQDYLYCLSLVNSETDPFKITNLQQDAFEKIFLKPFHHVEFCEIQEFISTHYKVYNNLLEYMRINYQKQVRQQKKTDVQLKAFTEIHKEYSLSDLFLREILTFFCLTQKLDPLQEINLFFQYFLLILAESIKEQTKANSFENIPLIETISNEFELQKHMDKLKQLLEYFLSYLCFRNIFPMKDLSKYDFCLISQYFEAFEVSYQNCLLKQSQSAKSSFIYTLERFTQVNLKTLNENYKFYTSKLKQKDQRKLKSCLALNLPFNFEKFKRIVDKKKCSKCERVPFTIDGSKHQKQSFGVSVCLICDYTVCRTMCKQDMDQNKPQKIGNLQQHAIDNHGGQCVFIDALITNLTYLNYPKNLVYESIYSTKYGELVGQSALNWQDYNLDENINETIRKAVIYNSIPETVFKYMNGYDHNFIIFQDKQL